MYFQIKVDRTSRAKKMRLHIFCWQRQLYVMSSTTTSRSTSMCGINILPYGSLLRCFFVATSTLRNEHYFKVCVITTECSMNTTTVD